jgi:hypothetical protein
MIFGKVLRKFRSLMLSALLLSGCEREPTQLSLEVVAEGEWMIADGTGERVLLRQLRTDNHAQRGNAGELRVAVLGDSLLPAELQVLQLPAGPGTVQVVRAINNADSFYFAGTGLSPFTRSPTDPKLYLFEHENAIWVFRAPASVHKLSLDDGIDALRAQQREGRSILYWATAPVWSSDGEIISFLTNRHGMHPGGNAQGIWVIHTGTGINKQLLTPARASLHTDAVLGEEFLFSSNVQPGVQGVHARTGATRFISAGYVMGFDPAGRAVLINDEARYLRVRPHATDTLPAPPRGHVYSSHAYFSPSARRLAVFSTDQQGDYVLHVFADDLQRLSMPVPGGPSYGPRWLAEDALLLVAQRPRAGSVTYRVHLR